MALHLIHGDNQFLSRQHFHQNVDAYKKRGIKDITNLDGRKVALEEVIQAVESNSFFESDRLTIIELLLSAPKSKRQTEIIDYLSQQDPKTSHIILWESKAATPAKLKKLTPFTPKLFKSSPVIFKFLDAVYPGNQITFLKLFSQACEQDSTEFVFYMLIKRVRQLIQSQGDSLKAAPWQISKLKSQYQQFTPAGLLDFHHRLYLLDNHLKTGQNPLPLQSELEILLINLV